MSRSLALAAVLVLALISRFLRFPLGLYPTVTSAIQRLRPSCQYKPPSPRLRRPGIGRLLLQESDVLAYGRGGGTTRPALADRAQPSRANQLVDHRPTHVQQPFNVGDPVQHQLAVDGALIQVLLHSPSPPS